MRNTDEIINDKKYEFQRLWNEADGSSWRQEDIEQMMKEYAKELLEHLMQEADTYIYVDEGDAVLSYDKIYELRDNLK